MIFHLYSKYLQLWKSCSWTVLISVTVPLMFLVVYVLHLNWAYFRYMVSLIFLQLRFTKGGCQLKMFTINVDFSFSFQARNHTDFLCRMKEYIPSRSVFTDGVIAALGEHFSVQPMDLQAILSSHEEFVPSTKLLSQQDLEEIVSSKESFRV